MDSQYSKDAVLEFHAEAPLATASEGFAKGPYVADRAGFETATLRTKGDESINEPPRQLQLHVEWCELKLHQHYLFQ